jgi:hypothetical protein
MLRWFVRLLYESTPAEFRSAYGLSESVERLRAATKRSVFSALGEAAAVGKVSETVVRLQRVIPMVRNSFKPFFVGRFEIRDGVTVLTGRFSMLTAAKIFMTFWFGMTFVFAAGVLLGKLSSDKPFPSFLVFQPFLMIGFGIALVAAGKWFARNDAAWLSKVIEGALGNTQRSDAMVPQALASFGAQPLPMTLKVASILLAGSGAMSLLFIVLGPQLLANSAGQEETFSPPPFGQWNFIYATLLILLSIGVWRRRPWAWWCGFAVVGTFVWGPLAAMHAHVGVGVPLAIQVIFGVFSLVVAAAWGWWWHAQRKHFVWA